MKFYTCLPYKHLIPWATLACFLSIIAACSPMTSAPPTSEAAKMDERTIAEAVVKFVPEEWELSDTVLEFSPGTLYEHINGNAELYLAYNVVKLTFSSYVNPGDAGQFVDLFIYDMGTPTQGFGIFSVERYSGEPPVNLGRLAYRSNASYFIWKGQYYIQVVASEDTEELQEIGLKLAQQTTDALTDTGEPVWGRSALPRENRIAETVKFFLVDAMGLDFMTDTYTADYQLGDHRLRAFLSRRLSAEAARTMVARYREYAGKYGKGTAVENVDGIDLVSCDMGRRYDAIFQKKDLVGGILSAEDKSVANRAAAHFWKQLPME